MNVRLIHITPELEKVIAYCARVSNPKNQDSDSYDKLLAYCIKNHHWSIFQMANMCLEIKTSRAISAQIIRHSSFSFQEFSQRYAEAQYFDIYDARRQDEKNRQNSLDDLPKETMDWFYNAQEEVILLANKLYATALEKNIAKESARFLLPSNTSTKLYMNGNIRSWITYIQVRTEKSTQLEHKEVAEECKRIFCEQLPTISKALGWIE